MEEILKTIKAERDTYLRTPEYTDYKFIMHMMQLQERLTINPRLRNQTGLALCNVEL